MSPGPRRRPSLRTSDIAAAAGIHPNTVRLFEELGFLPKAPRSPSGYRMFSERHLDQVLLVRTLTRCTWLGGTIRDRALSAAVRSAGGDFAQAIAEAQELLGLIQAERAQAELAAAQLEAWARGGAPLASGQDGMTIREAAAYLAVTPDTLRNWDRNGLVRVPRHRTSGYRVYRHPELQRLLVIRTLRRARYSVMSILRMLRQLDAGQGTDPRAALDGLPPGEEDIFHSTDRWLTRVREIENYAREARQRLEEMARRYG